MNERATDMISYTVITENGNVGTVQADSLEIGDRAEVWRWDGNGQLVAGIETIDEILSVKFIWEK
jgi:hypothetical protein